MISITTHTTIMTSRQCCARLRRSNLVCYSSLELCRARSRHSSLVRFGSLVRSSLAPVISLIFSLRLASSRRRRTNTCLGTQYESRVGSLSGMCLHVCLNKLNKYIPLFCSLLCVVRIDHLLLSLLYVHCCCVSLFIFVVVDVVLLCVLLIVSLCRYCYLC